MLAAWRKDSEEGKTGGKSEIFLKINNLICIKNCIKLIIDYNNSQFILYCFPLLHLYNVN